MCFVLYLQFRDREYLLKGKDEMEKFLEALATKDVSKVIETFDNLRDMEKKILNLTFGLQGQIIRSPKQIGELLTMDEEKVCQVQNRLMQQLREAVKA